MIAQKGFAFAERTLFVVKAGTDVSGFERSKTGSQKRAEMSVIPQLSGVRSLLQVTRKQSVLPQPLDLVEDNCYMLSLTSIFGGTEVVPRRLDQEEPVSFKMDIYCRLLSRSMKQYRRQQLAKREGRGDDGEWVLENTRYK